MTRRRASKKTENMLVTVDGIEGVCEQLEKEFSYIDAIDVPKLRMAKVITETIKEDLYEEFITEVYNKRKPRRAIDLVYYYTCYMATWSGNLSVIKTLIDLGYVFDEEMCVVAAKYGHYDVLQYLHKLGIPLIKAVCERALYNKDIKILEYAIKNGCSWDKEIVYLVIEQDAIEAFIHMCHQGLEEHGCEWDESLCEHAARYNAITILEYILMHGCPCDEYMASIAAEFGNLQALNSILYFGCPWDEYTCIMAAQNGHTDCLMFAHKHGCPWDSRVCFIAYKNNHRDCLRYAMENNCPCDPKMRNTYMEFLKNECISSK